MRKRTITYIEEVIAEFRAQHQQRFPNVRSPFPRAGDSWNAIDSALRRGAIVECQRFAALKAQLAERGWSPSLARLNKAYSPRRQFKRRFADILAMVNRSVKIHHRFPLRRSRFEVPGYVDTWIAIDCALSEGAIADCVLWRQHRDKMAQLGVRPSLASLNPAYFPVRRQQRSVAAIKAMIVSYMLKNAGQLPHQRARFPAGFPPDAWKAICKALRLGSVLPDADRTVFYDWVAADGRNPSLHTFMQCYRDELAAEYAQRSAQPDGAATQRRAQLAPAMATDQRPVKFAALIAPLF
ncbi:hypothetical protein GTP45_09530 [Pseudoduganella sp. FT55W]|uniref:Uncharacterized protein n=1 Tax=Duganella rivi TaxID=2666083 RepID=A0A7X4GP87_9BURK|nr:hypothetical protein [Duganella rivi]MYM67068.1 hypothetical protein [Duganella rivi]